MMRAETNALRDEIRSQFQSLTDAAETTRPKPDPELRERLAHAAPMPHPCRRNDVQRRECYAPASLTAEAALLVNDLATRVCDLSDPDEIAAAMPAAMPPVKYNLSKRPRCRVLGQSAKPATLNG